MKNNDRAALFGSGYSPVELHAKTITELAYAGSIVQAFPTMSLGKSANLSFKLKAIAAVHLQVLGNI